MKIKELEIKNFQSHKHTKIKFFENFNCIVGESRTGKSSIFRALDFLFFNKWVSDYVTFGEIECSIKAVFEDFTIERIKGEKINKVIFTDDSGKGVTYENFGTDYPDDIKAHLNLSEIVIDDKKALPLNTSNQDAPLFILYESGIFKSKLFGYIAKTQAIDTILADLSKDKKESSERKKTLESFVEDKEVKLKDMDAILSSKDAVEEIGIKLDGLRLDEDKLNILITLKNKFDSYKKKVSELKTKSDLANTIDPDKIEKVIKYYKLSDQLKKYKEKYDKYDDSLVSIAKTEVTLASEESKVNEELQKIEVCPTCGQPTHPDYMIGKDAIDYGKYHP